MVLLLCLNFGSVILPMNCDNILLLPRETEDTFKSHKIKSIHLWIVESDLSRQIICFRFIFLPCRKKLASVRV